MAWGITPYKSVTVPLEAYNADHYLTLLYHAIQTLGWRIGYFDHDGIIAYTNISWESYAEEISVRVKNNAIIIKSECVGYQGFFTDYGKNEKNLDLLFGEIEYTHFHLQHNLEETTQELMNSVPEKQFLNLYDPPMAGKEKIRSFIAVFTPQQKYFVTPLLVLANIGIYFLTFVAMWTMFVIAATSGRLNGEDNIAEKIYLLLGYSDRYQVLNGQVWRLITNVFLHFSLMHLAGNMVALIYIGSMIESKLSRLNYLLLYLFTGIVASMVSVMWRDEGLSAGASGAIFGLFGILLALLSTDFYEHSARRALLISTGIFVVINIVPIGQGVDHAAHFGGLISGYIFGWIAYLSFINKNYFIQKWGLAISSLIIVTVFISCSIIFTPEYNLKEFSQLIQKTEVMSGEIKGYFYDGEDLDKSNRLDTLERKALPEIKDFNKLAINFDHLILPDKKKREAVIRSKLIVLQCRFYTLLYNEFKENNKVKYRPEIANITDRMNELRKEWGSFVEAEE